MRSVIVLIPFVAACASGRTSNVPASPAPPVVIERAGAAPLRVEKDIVAGGGTVAAPVEQVWYALVVVYRELGIEPTTFIAESRTIGNGALKIRRSLGGTALSRYLDCGAGTGVGPNADYYNVEMSVMTRLSPKADSTTDVRSVVQATATPVSLGSNPVVCSSTSTLETRIARMAQEKVAAGGT